MVKINEGARPLLECGSATKVESEVVVVLDPAAVLDPLAYWAGVPTTKGGSPRVNNCVHMNTDNECC